MPSVAMVMLNYRSASSAKNPPRLPGSAETISVMLAVFARVDPALRKSITFDNDTAFAQHALLRTMRAMTTWFCDAYASWQKGGVENANGRLRRWLPRHIDIDKVSDEEIQDIVLIFTGTYLRQSALASLASGTAVASRPPHGSLHAPPTHRALPSGSGVETVTGQRV